MTLTEQLVYLLLVLPLAAGAVIDVWRNGSIFAELRARNEMRTAAFERGEFSIRNFVAALLDCSFCMSFHVPLWFVVTRYLPAVLLEHSGWHRWAQVVLLPSYCLAATRVSWLVNGLVPDHLRYTYKVNKANDTLR